MARKAGGWVPNQHGAWAFVIVPSLLGIVWAALNGQFRASLPVLFITWLLGYFAFFATTQWLKSRRRPRYRNATYTYCGITCALGALLLVLEPHWWSWGLVFAPLTGLALWLVLQKKERSVTSGLVTVTAACLLPLVVGSRGLTQLDGLPELGIIAAVCFGYFFGTVFYVKTMIRERGSRTWIAISVAWHLAWAAGSLWLPTAWAWLITLFFLAASVRALLVPVFGPMQGRRITAKQVGIGEFVGSGLLIAVLVLVAL